MKKRWQDFLAVFLFIEENLKFYYMDLNMNQFDFLINGPEYEPQLVYRV